MFLALAKLPALREGVQKRLVRTPVERGKLQPRLQTAQDLFGFGRQAGDQVFEHGNVTSTESATLRHQPAVELRAAVDLEPLQKVTFEAC